MPADEHRETHSREAAARSDSRPTSPPKNESLKKQLLDDMESLEHRIAKLKVEEFRTQAAVKALDRQMDIIEARKADYSRDQERKDYLRQMRQREEDALRESIASARQRQKESIQEALSRSLEAKRDAVDELRRLRMIYDCERNVQLANDREKILAKHDAVRDTDTRVKTKAVRQAARRVEMIREQERKEVERDTAEREEKIAKLKKLEREERALKDRLAQIKRVRDEKAERLQQVDTSRPGTRQANTPRSRSSTNNNGKDTLPPI